MLLKMAICALGALAAADSLPSSGWTLEDCVERGLLEAAAIRRQGLEVEQAAEDGRIAVLGCLPTVSLSASQDFSWGRAVDLQELVIVRNKMNSSTSFSANASLSVSQAVSSAIVRKEAESRRRKAEADLEEMRSSLAIEIARAYMQYMLAVQIRENATISYEDICQQRDRLTKEAAAGKASYGSLAEMEAQAATEKASLAEAEGGVKSAWLALTRHLNLKPGEAFEVSPPADDSLLPPDITQMWGSVEILADRHPVMIGSRAAMEESRHMRRRAAISLLPELSVSGYYGSGYSDTGEGTFGDQISSNWNPALNVTLTIPILNGYSAIRQARSSEREAEKRKADLDERRLSLENEMKEMLLDAANCYDCYVAAAENKSALENVFRLNRARFEAGAISGSEYILCRNNWRKAVAECLKAEYRYILQKKITDWKIRGAHSDL